MLIAVFRDFDAANQFHYEIRATGFSRSRVKYFRDIRMIHQGERLSFSLKPGNDTFGVHARLNDFQSDSPSHWPLLLGHENDAATPFSDLLQQFVFVDLIAGLFTRSEFNPDLAKRPGWRCFQEVGGTFVGSQQRLNSATQLLVTSTGLFQKSN